MRTLRAVVATVAAVLLPAVPALASDAARDVPSVVESYAASATGDASLVGAPGAAGYDAGFWVRGGDFSLRVRATLQARFEAIGWDSVEPGDPGTFDPFGFGGGDRSGFSVPRAILKLSGAAPCDTRYHVELDFGHFGREILTRGNPNVNAPIGPNVQSNNGDTLREAWIELGCSRCLNVRMGQVPLPTTRQLMTPPELQQFVDVSYASSIVGAFLPGYTDRNRDHGILFHGAFGCEHELSWTFAVTNGDGGDSIRNVLDGRTDDDLAFSGRLNWCFLGATGYEEGALRQDSCTWYGEVGAWAFFTANRHDKPHVDVGDHLRAGADVQLGYGGLSFTGAFNVFDSTFDGGLGDFGGWTSLVQVGFLFPDTAWEVAARWSHVDYRDGFSGSVDELAGAVGYYLSGHGNKLTLDASLVRPDGINFENFDPWPGFADFQTPGPTGGVTDNAYLLLRLQWQLAL